MAQRFAHCDDYYKLKDETKDVEVLRRGAERLMRESEREQQPSKKRDLSRLECLLYRPRGA